MAGLLYFVPGARTPNIAEDALRKAGAAHALAEANSTRGCDKGPGDLAGFIIAPVPEPPGEPAADLYHPDEQVWARVGPEDAPAYWLGYESARPPRPEDLARPAQHRGHVVELNGTKWLAPVARLYTGRIAFPQKLARTNGEWVLGDIADDCAKLWEVASKYFDETMKAPEDGQLSITEGDAADMASIALGANYRLGPEEIGVLELLDTRRTMKILNALIDLPSVMALQKKAPAPGGSSTGPGAPA